MYSQLIIGGVNLIIKLDEYRLYCLENELAKNTLNNYINTLKQLDKFLTRNKAECLNKELLIEFKQHIKTDEYAPGKTYKTSTCNQKITAINIYLNWDGEKELTLKLFKEQTKSHRESITKEDFERLLRHADEEMKLFILTIANTGLRISEVKSLTKQNLSEAIITIENKGKQRIIDIPLFLKKELRTYYKNLDEEKVLFYKTEQYYRNKLKEIAGKARVKKSRVYPHSIRHYFAKSFIAQGGDSTALQQMLGHSDIKTTTIYTKMSKEELAKTFRKIKNN